MDLNYKFTFGKYKDLTISDVSQLDYKYLKWCENNIGWFEIPKGAYELHVDSEFRRVINNQLRSVMKDYK